MTIRIRALAIGMLLAGGSLAWNGLHARVAAQGGAQTADSAVYVVRLGVDTVAIERWRRDADSMNVVSVSRSPRTIVRRFVVRFDADGRVLNVNTGEQGPPPTPTNGAVPIAGGTFAPYALAVWQALRAGGNAAVPMLVGSNTRNVTVERRSATEFTLPNQFDQQLIVRLTADGAVASIDAGGGSTVERVAWFDIEPLTRDFAARDDAGTGLGMLSPRDTAHAMVAGAHILIDYSRPFARGRTVMGGLVPYGAVWRTGANQAAELVTDTPIRIGDLRLEAGRYSLFTIPGENSWELIVNRQLGISGLEHDPAHDVGRVTMRALPSTSHTEQFTIVVEQTTAGARLRITWGTANVAVPIAGG